MRDLLALFLHFFYDPGPTVRAGWDTSRHCGDIADQTSVGGPESIPAKGPQSDSHGPHRNGVMHVVYEPEPDPKGGGRAQARDLTGISPSDEGAQVPPPFLTATPRQARTERPFEGTRPSHRRDEAPEPTLRMSEDCTAALKGVWYRDKQRRGEAGSCEAALAPARRRRSVVVDVHRSHKG